MNKWSYRVVKENEMYSIRECLYDKNDNIFAVSEDLGYITCESIEENEIHIERMRKALEKDVVDGNSVDNEKEIRRNVTRIMRSIAERMTIEECKKFLFEMNGLDKGWKYPKKNKEYRE